MVSGNQIGQIGSCVELRKDVRYRGTESNNAVDEVFEMDRMLTTQDISWFLDQYERNQLNLEPAYQRRSVWSPRDKKFFVDTILNNYPAPPVFLHKTMDDDGRATYHVVDGKQRLQTIIEFTRDRVRIPDDFVDRNLQKKRWKDLSRETREKFWNYEVIVEMIPNVEEAQIRSTFDRINRNSRRLTPQELRHAKYEGWFIQFVEREAEKAEWKACGVVTTARIKRMLDVQFISELCAVILKGRIIGFDQDALDDIYAEYEDISELSGFVEDDFVDHVERLKNSIVDMIGLRPALSDSLRAQSNFYSLWSYLFLKRDSASLPNGFVERYDDFMKAVQTAKAAQEETIDPDTSAVLDGDSGFRAAVIDYANNTKGASTDLTPRTKRHEALVAVM